MKTKTLFLMATLVVLLSTCKKNSPNQDPYGTCPCATDEFYFRDHLGFGMWRCGYTGADGDIGIATGGAVTRNIISNCPWQFYSNDTHGGTGHIYQVITADTSVRFTWENTSLHQIEVFKNWKGSTENGSSIGNTVTQFLQKESGFVVTADSTVYTYTTSTVIVTASFTNKNPTVGKLMELHLHAQ